jgi:hypothetical protein
MAETKRDAMLAKIRALRAKTEQAGATEAEAMAAAEMASRLMAAWEIEEAELAEAEARKPDLDLGQDQTVRGGRIMPKVWMCCNALEALTRCRVVHSSVRDGHKFTVIGDRPDREFFLYLFGVIESAMDREYAGYAARNAGRLGSGAKGSFQVGMSIRINERIRAMIAERDAVQRASASRALVLVDTKKAAVAEHLRKVFPKLRRVSSSVRAGNGGAFGAGRVAGDRVGLSRGIGGGSRALLG